MHSINVETDILLSARDISQRYGKSRQYWEKLMREGKIHYHQTRAGKITTDKWVEMFINRMTTRSL